MLWCPVPDVTCSLLIVDEHGRDLDGADLSIVLGDGPPLLVEDAGSHVTLASKSVAAEITVEVTWRDQSQTRSIEHGPNEERFEFATGRAAPATTDADVHRELTIVDVDSTNWSLDSIQESETTTIGLDPTPQAPALVLMCTANALHSKQLRLDQEMKIIKEGLKNANHRDSAKFEISPQVTFSDVIRNVEDLEPMFLHFSGHSDHWNRLVLEGTDGTPKLVSPPLLAELLEGLPTRPTLVTFATCHSWALAQAAARHVPFAIGFRGRLSDARAPVFSAMLYDRLFSRPKLDVPRAFRSAQLDFEGETPKEQRQSGLFQHPRAETTGPTSPVDPPRPSGDAGTRRKLVHSLAGLLHNPSEAKMTARRAGLEPGLIPQFENPTLFWEAVVTAAYSGKIERGPLALVDEALGLYRYNDTLKALRATLAAQGD